MRRVILEEYLDREPFLPFRIYLSTGAFVDIRNPQFASISPSTLNLGLPIEGDRQRFLEIALLHIVWIEITFPTP